MADALTALAASTGAEVPNTVNSIIGPGAIASRIRLSLEDEALLSPYINNFGTAATSNGKVITRAQDLIYSKEELNSSQVRIYYSQFGPAEKPSKSYGLLHIAFYVFDDKSKDTEFIKYAVIVTTLNKVYFIYESHYADKYIYYLSPASNWNQPPAVPKVDKTPASATDGVKPVPNVPPIPKVGGVITNPDGTKPVPNVPPIPKIPGVIINPDGTKPVPNVPPIPKIPGVTPVAPTINVPSTETPVATKVEDFSNKFNPADAFYRIIYTDNQNNTKAFVFTFLPARETKMGNWNVPEARTGMPIQTKMRHKMQVIPGAGPIVQTIGVNGTTITVVGALLGNEIIAQNFVGAGPSAYPRYESGTFSGAETEGIYSAGLPRGAYDKVQELTNRLVYPGRPVTIEIKPSNTQATFQMGEGKNNIGDFIRMTGVVTAVRVQYAHSDRCYYALDLFVTSYPNQPVSLNPDVTASASDTTPIAFATTTNQDGVDLNSLSELDPIETQAIPLTPFAKVAANFLSGQPILSSVSQAIAAFDDRTISNVSTIAQSGNIYNAISNLSATGLSTAAQMETLAQLAQLSNIDSTGIAAITAAITRGVG